MTAVAKQPRRRKRRPRWRDVPNPRSAEDLARAMFLNADRKLKERPRG